MCSWRSVALLSDGAMMVAGNTYVDLLNRVLITSGVEILD